MNMKRHTKTTFLKAIALISCITGAVHAAETITVQPRDNGASAALPAQAADTVSSMAIGGQWAYRFDPEDKNLADGWAQALVAEGATELPGTTDTRGLGPVNSESSEIHLLRAYKYRGAVWYEREVEIPAAWAGQAVTLEMERVQWESRLWVDGKPAGMQDSLSTPHIYDLTGLLTPGRHRLTLRIDNRLKHVIYHRLANWEATHAISDETQGNWNGVIGRMELRASPLLALEQIQVGTLPGGTAARATVRVNNRTGQAVNITLTGKVLPGGAGAGEIAAAAAPGISTHGVEVPLRADAQRWDEFSPVMQNLGISLTAPGRPQVSRTVRFGLLDFKAGRRQFELNSRRLLLRGNLECAIWPLTGHPPMTPDSGWRKLMATVKEHGMNHLRFHSWCPPEAAFVAADEAGMILQVELPLWDGYGDIAAEPKRCVWLREEAYRIIGSYGNHPSFRLMSMGNELASAKGDDPWLMDLVRELKQFDPRILYASTTYPVFASSSDDFFVAAGTVVGGIRGAGPAASGRPGFDGTFTAATSPIDRPLLAHEIGQFSMFFNPGEIAKYTGSMKPRNLEMFRAAMEKNGLLEMVEPFRKSSAHFQLQLYKREMEQQLATPELAGFQALGLQDFSGQGTTMCGFLDAFWETKGVFPASAWRRFCAPTVVLARFPEAVLTDADTFTAKVQVSHYGPRALTSAVVRWELNACGHPVASGAFPPADIATGKLTDIGEIRHALTGLVQAPAAMKLSVWLEQESVTNDWNLWVYPAKPVDPAPPPQMLIANEWDAACKQALAEGRDVILFPKVMNLKKGVPTQWYPVCWNMALFASQPSTIGIHLDPAHPLFAKFPTAEHSNAQWQKLLDGGAAGMDLTGTALRPLVWLIHDFHTAYQRKLGAVFEARVGKGRLLVSTLNLVPENRQWPEVRQFLASLYGYAGSESFAPSQTATVAELDSMLAAYALAPGGDHPPEGLENAVYHVAAAVLASPGNSTADRKLDQIKRQSPGIDYNVTCDGFWKDDHGSAWYGSSIILKVTVPENFKGRLAVRFSDWNKDHRNGHLFFNGMDQSRIGPHEAGRWLVFKLDEQTSKTREYTLKADRISGVNLMMTDFAVLDDTKP
jgi:Glycosyl hydrolases family 2, sugar binding domain